MRLFTVLLLISLTACVPITPAPALVFVSTPTYGLAGQSVVIQATQESLALTRAVLDAQSADATSRAAQATADWQATQSSLSVQQTQAAMLATANESARIATHESAKATGTAQAQSDVATAQAADTATAQAFNGALLQQAISATGTALAIRASSLATQESAKADEAKNWQRVKGVVGEVFQWGMVILVFGSIIIGLYYAYRIGEDARNHRRDMQHQLLLQAGAETTRATIILVEGKNYRATPDGELVPLSETITTQSVENKARASRLRAACKRFVYAAVQLSQDGEENAFGERAMTIRNLVVTRPGTDQGWTEGYRTIKKVLVDVKVLYVSDRKTLTWAEGWGLVRFEQEFDLVPLPEVPEAKIPDVRITLRSSALHADFRSSAVPQLEEESEGQD